MILPSSYTQLGYIESSGSQYIDTGVKANQNTKMVLDCEITYGTDWIRIAGSYDSNAYFSWWANGSQIYAYYGSDNKNAAAPSGRTVLIADKNVWTAGTATGTFSASTFSASSSIYLFAVAQGGNQYAKATMKLYSCQIYDNGTLVRDFVPCRSGFSNAGLYDLVNGKYYSNAGSGSFTQGEYVPEVTGEYEILHIPVSEVYACGNDHSDHYPEAWGTFSASDGIVQDGDTVSLASPVYTFSLDTTDSSYELPPAGSYILVRGVIYQVTSESYADPNWQTYGGWTSEETYSTWIDIRNLNKVILGISNATTEHSALIDNVQRSISGGFAFVNGTGYEIAKGRTLIDGTGRDIKFGISAYIEVETYNQAEGYSSNQGKATITHTESDDVLFGSASFSKGWYSVPTSGKYAGIVWHIIDEETGGPYLLQPNDIVEWEVEAAVTGDKSTTRVLFFTNTSDSWSSDVAEYSCTGYETTHVVTRECYMEFNCYVLCSNYNAEATLNIKKLTINGQDVWVK